MIAKLKKDLENHYMNNGTDIMYFSCYGMKVYNELLRRFEKSNFDTISIEMKSSGEKLEITPCSYKKKKSLANIDSFLIQGNQHDNWLCYHSLPELAAAILDYDNIIADFQKQDNNVTEFYNKHIKNMSKRLASIGYELCKKTNNYPDAKGRPLEEIRGNLEEYLFDEMKYSVNVIKPIITQIKKILEEDEQLHLEGANRAFDLPEFNSLEIAKNFVNILDTKDLMTDILNTGLAKDINVYIGEESEKEELKDFSIITFKHRVGNKDLGTIGIIGPKRMNYSKVISIMKYISKKLNENGEENAILNADELITDDEENE